mmetsp:Transcript_12130/g.18339  ORF Transcript_12130/g.18339 Transcript_12130/m.18339 type:complete len:275 (+) Transcript_12130:75-899(+)
MLKRQIPLLCVYLSSVTKVFSLAPSSTRASQSILRSNRKLSSLNMSSSNIGLSDIGKSSSTEKSSESKNNITTWREKISISSAKSRKVRGGNYVQIATVDPETMEPRCRTVVFRGFVKKDKEETSIMKMITDKRSSKYGEVTNIPSSEGKKSTCELLWWFGKSSEQYRIRGDLKFVDGDEKDSFLVTARKAQWGNMSDPAREQFYWKEPGVPYESESEVPTGGRDEDGKVLPPPDNFLLMLLHPVRCDYLRLGDNFRQVDDLVDDEWVAQRVTP